MSRPERRKHGEPGSREPGWRRPGPSDKLTLADTRFDTPDASKHFLNLRYFDDAFKGNSETSVRLPAHPEPVSTTPRSGGMVYKAYPHGLMYGDQLSMFGGVGLFAGVAMTGLAVMWGVGGDLPGFFERNLLLSIVLGMVFTVLYPLILFVFIGDLIGFRFDTSVLFDRHAGTVRVFADKSMPWRPWKYDLKSYDWRCVRAEIDTVSVFTGTLGRKEAGLRCVVYDRPGGDKVVDQFVLGTNMPAQHIQPLLDSWEHVRRFMQHEGPLFADEADRPNPSLGRPSLWQCLTMFPALEITSTISMFKIAWQDKSLAGFWAGLLGVAVAPFLWVLIPFGIFPWVSGLAKREPIWPAEVLASVGGHELRGRDLEAWRRVVPSEATTPLQPAQQTLESR